MRKASGIIELLLCQQQYFNWKLRAFEFDDFCFVWIRVGWPPAAGPQPTHNWEKSRFGRLIEILKLLSVHGTRVWPGSLVLKNRVKLCCGVRDTMEKREAISQRERLQFCLLSSRDALLCFWCLEESLLGNCAWPVKHRVNVRTSLKTAHLSGCQSNTNHAESSLHFPFLAVCRVAWPDFRSVA